MKKLLLSSALLFGLYVMGCSSSASLTCETKAGVGHECTSASASGAGTGSGTATCPASTTSVSSCPTSGSIGTCSITESAGGVTASSSITYYSDGGFTASTEESACKAAGGTWAS